jgi:hypothetical protein
MVTFYSLFPTTTESIIFQIVLALWILSEIVGGTLIPYIRRGGAVLNRKDKGSGLFIFFIIFLSIIIAIVLASANIAILPIWFFYPGIIVMILGIIFR